MATYLRHWCAGDLCHETSEEISGSAVFALCCGLWNCGVYHRLYWNQFLGNAAVGLSRTVFESSRNHLFSQRRKLCRDGIDVPLYAGTGSRADGWKNKFQNPSGNLYGASNHICGGLRSQRAVSDTDYLLGGMYAK